MVQGNKKQINSSQSPKSPLRENEQNISSPNQEPDTDTGSETGLSETTETVTETTNEYDVEKKPEKERIEKKPPKRSPTPSRCQCKSCSCQNCCNKLCPYFPRCCNLPLGEILQILSIIDLIVIFLTLSLWVTIHQYDPFHIRAERNVNVTITNETSSSTNSSNTTTESVMFIPEYSAYAAYDALYHETTTDLPRGLYGYIGDEDENVDPKTYTKVAYDHLDYQEEVEENCGSDYYKLYLSGLSLNLTVIVYNDIVYCAYFIEGVALIVSVSIFVTTCCFFKYASGKNYLILIWHLAFFPFLPISWVSIAIQSQRLCIFQFGINPNYKLMDLLFLCHILPLFLFRIYRLLIFTYFIKSMFPPGADAAAAKDVKKIKSLTLKEHRNRHKEYIRMDERRKRSSSEDDEIEDDIL